MIHEKEKLIKILRTLLDIDNLEVMHYTIESLIEGLEDNVNDLGNNEEIDE